MFDFWKIKITNKALKKTKNWEIYFYRILKLFSVIFHYISKQYYLFLLVYFWWFYWDYLVTLQVKGYLHGFISFHHLYSLSLKRLKVQNPSARIIFRYIRIKNIILNIISIYIECPHLFSIESWELVGQVEGVALDMIINSGELNYGLPQHNILLIRIHVNLQGQSLGLIKHL